MDEKDIRAGDAALGIIVFVGMILFFIYKIAELFL